MKIDKKDIIFWILIAIVFGALFVITKDNGRVATVLTPTPTAEIIETTPTPTEYILPTTTPKPYLRVEELGTYQRLFDELDPKNRVLGIYDECQQLVPSNVSYSNNTEIMLDNTRSNQSHILKIGDADYVLDAKQWRLINLSSLNTPVDLPLFCEGIELGSIRLE